MDDLDDGEEEEQRSSINAGSRNILKQRKG